MGNNGPHQGQDTWRKGSIRTLSDDDIAFALEMTEDIRKNFTKPIIAGILASEKVQNPKEVSSKNRVERLLQ